MKALKYIIIFFIIVLIPVCGKKKEENKVSLEQLNTDKSNDYRYIFKDVIDEQRKIKERGKKDPFKD